jgi:hypothetical protein
MPMINRRYAGAMMLLISPGPHVGQKSSAAVVTSALYVRSIRALVEVLDQRGPSYSLAQVRCRCAECAG